MMPTRETLQRERTDAVLSLSAARLQPAQSSLVEAFGREYFRRLDPDDLLARSTEDLLGAMLAHWQFGARRLPGQTLVQVLSPALAEHGWVSRHSVIDIVNDDMPFLVDTTTMEINRQGLALHLIVHPIYAVQRDAQGQLVSIRPRSEAAEAPGTGRESWIHIEVDRIIEPLQRADLATGLERVLGDVRAAVQDWQPMLAQLRKAMAELQAAGTAPGGLAGEQRAAQVQESLAFLQWLAEDHMTFLGYRCHDLVTEAGGDALRLVAGSGLGVLRETA
ncbi:MAG: NAD-glutamate dehydrogenase, partial [Burkholderiaceae bacterium]